MGPGGGAATKISIAAGPVPYGGGMAGSLASRLFGRDRRRHERTKATVPCRLVVGDDVLVGKTRDISLGGVAFAVQLAPEVRGRLAKGRGTMSLMLPRGEIEAQCRVVRVMEEMVALEFHKFARTPQCEDLREFLRTQLSKLL